MSANGKTADKFTIEDQHKRCVIDLLETETGHNDNSEQSSSLTPFFSPVIHQRQLLHTFVWSMTASHQNELSPALGTYRRWLPYLFPLTGTHTLLDESVRACTLAHVGRLHCSNIFMREAQLHYGRALRLLNDALQDPARGLASETLGSTILLSIFEMFTSASNSNWIRHADGVGTLMKLRGPHMHRTGVDREMFLAYRRTLLSQATQTGQRTFLNDYQWRLLSRNIHDDIRKSGVFGDVVKSEIFGVDQLLFLETTTLCDLSHDLGHVHSLAQMTGEDPAAFYSRLIPSVSSCRRTVKSLLRRLRTAITSAGHEPLSHVTNDPVYPTQYEFVNMYVASLHVGLWTTIMRANLLLMRFEKSQQKLQQYYMENTQTARRCCQSVAYMATSSFLGPFFMIFALQLCLLVLDDQVEKTWIVEKLREFGKSKLAFAKDIPGRSGMQDIKPNNTLEIWRDTSAKGG